MNAEVAGVRVAGTPEGPVPVVILEVDGHEDVLPIFIGFEEAHSIARGLEATDIGRPLTHDLLLDTLEALGARLTEVAVTEVTEGGTYIADIHVQTPRGKKRIDARPSDSMALAVRTNAPIRVAEPVFEAGRRAPEPFAELDDIRGAVGESGSLP